MSSQRDELFQGHEDSGGSAGVPDYGATGHAALEAQRSAMRAQDSQLDDLSVGVSGIRNVAGLLSTEVEEQNKLLDGLTRDVEAADDRTQAVAKRTDATEKSPYSIHNFCMLLWPVVLLIVFVVVGFKHFIFG